MLFLFSFTAGFILLHFFRRRRASRRARFNLESERSLWASFASGLFDSPADPIGRTEATLAEVARKLRLRAGLVTMRAGAGRKVLAVASLDERLIAGLARGSTVPLGSLFCGMTREDGSSLAINYASLSDWRRHPACSDLSWESYLGASCGLAGRSDLVVAFFDTIPREQPFTQAERSLVEQLGPWIAAMAAADDFPGASAEGIVYPISEPTKSRDA